MEATEKKTQDITIFDALDPSKSEIEWFSPGIKTKNVTFEVVGSTIVIHIRYKIGRQEYIDQLDWVEDDDEIDEIEYNLFGLKDTFFTFNVMPEGTPLPEREQTYFDSCTRYSGLAWSRKLEVNGVSYVAYAAADED